MSPDTIPLWFAATFGALALIACIVLEFRASARYWAERDTQDPVVVTASGRPSNRYPRACPREEVV